MNLAGKVALITGGGTGIGAAAAYSLASLGAVPIVLGPDLERLAEVARATGGRAIVGDAGDPRAVGQCVAMAEAIYGALDIVVTCAGGGAGHDLAATDDEAWSASIRLNLETARVTIRACLLPLIRSRGSIVIVSSLAGVEAVPQSAGYVTAKHALIGLMRSLACDYGPRGVRVNAVCPGLTRTAVADAAMSDIGAREGLGRDDIYRRATRSSPLQRPLEPAEVGRVVTFLASDWASGMTGAVVIVDGGATAVSVF